MGEARGRAAEPEVGAAVVVADAVALVAVVVDPAVAGAVRAAVVARAVRDADPAARVVVMVAAVMVDAATAEASSSRT